jgi:hypothetical protein
VKRCVERGGELSFARPHDRVHAGLQVQQHLSNIPKPTIRFI